MAAAARARKANVISKWLQMVVLRGEGGLPAVMPPNGCRSTTLPIPRRAGMRIH